MSRFRSTRLLALAVALACGREVVFVDPPPTSTTDTTGTDSAGTDTAVVQWVDLEVTVTIASADTALATRLGFVNGRLSSAQVTARRLAGQQAPQTGTTDSLGQVTMPGLLEGVWAITVLRPLSEAERGLLDSANADVTGFAGAVQLSVAGPAPAVTIETPAGRLGTLVLNESYLPVEPIGGSNLGGYIEVHNNAFDTLYLDGKIIARSIPWVTEGSLPCSTMARWREDPDGIWTRLMWAFPGGGSDYPLAPGASVIIATDAIDHRTTHPDLLDLSAADFEFIGGSDVDNPSVPNMRNFPGWSDLGDPIGHGPRWGILISVFLAEAVQPDSLIRDNLPVQSPLHVRVPAEKILDVLTSGLVPERQSSAYCANFVHPSFDGRFAELVDGSMTHSLARRPFASGLGQSLRTKVSAVDFEHAPPTPGRVQ